MKPNAICITVFVLCITLHALAQQQNFPLPDKSRNIQFGKKPTASLERDERQEKIFRTMYPGSDKSKNIDEIIAMQKKSSPHLFNDPNSFLMRHLENRNPSITKTRKPPHGLGSGFHLTADINSLAESDPGNIGFYISPLDWVYPVVNNVSYSEGDDGVHGRELLRSNGTAAGTYLVKDINPGEASTLIRNMIAIGSKVYFSASTDGYTYHLWVTDGTEAGTKILDGVNGGSGYSPQQFIAVNNTVYFIGDGIGYRTAIWKTDGTAVGTSLVTDIYSLDYFGYDIEQATAVNGILFFTFYSGSYGRQVWRSDGTVDGTFMVKNVSAYGSDNNAPMQLTAYNNKLYFSADDGTGRKLWISDGTEIGTTYAPGNNDILMQTDNLQFNFSQPFPILNNVLYLSGYTYADGNGLYKYNAATNTGLVLVKDLSPSADAIFILPGESRVVGNTLYMKINNSVGGWHDELWSTKGDAASTKLVKSFAGEPGAFMLSLKNGYGTLYFVKYDVVYGGELWKSDGTTAGTMIVKDVNAGPKTSQPWYITECNGKVLFSLHETKTGAELWSTQGSSASTTLVKDINTTSTYSSNAGTFYNGIIATKNGVLFGAFEPATGGELYKSDGNENGTELLNDIVTGEGWSYPNRFKEKKGVYYFIGDNEAGSAIYKTDGTKKGLKKITVDINRDIYSLELFDISDNGKPFYILYNRSTGGFELWTSNGTAAGTIILSSNLPFNPGVVTCGNNAFFSAGDFTYGYELWKSDGTLTGTKMVKDINPGINSSYLFSIISYNGSIYFSANDNTYIPSLWKSNGTEAGTFSLANVQFPWIYLNQGLDQYFCIINNTLYFSGFSNDIGQGGLWKTNGTAAGTKQVGTGVYNPFNLKEVDGDLFFGGNDLNFNYGLWKLGPKETNPQLIKSDVYPQYSTGACGKLYFSHNDAIWSSDGTSGGTNPVNDPFLTGLNSITNLVGSNNKLFFSANSYQTGFELFVGNACSASTQTRAAQRSAPIVSQASDEIRELAIYPNPARDIVNVAFHRQSATWEKITVTDISGRLLLDKNVITIKGNNSVPVSIKSLPRGSYFIKLSGDKNKVKQFVKLD
ncbi:MAG: T9SS type A sorting domain-containing protein [Chitinophagaceae bacterium]